MHSLSHDINNVFKVTQQQLYNCNSTWSNFPDYGEGSSPLTLVCISFREGRDFHLKTPVPPSLQVFPWSGGVRGGAPAIPGAGPEQSGGGLSLPGQAQ